VQTDFNIVVGNSPEKLPERLLTARRSFRR